MKSELIQNSGNLDSTKAKIDSKIPLIHIIGYVDAGKSTFIKKYLNEFPIFDIKDIYQKNFFSPKDLQNDPEKYLQFQTALDYSFTQYYKNLEINHFSVGIIESSGINQALNNILRRFYVYRVWIIPFDLNLIQSKIYRIRPYAEELNTHLMEKFEKNEVPFNNKYNFMDKSFMKDLPEIFKRYF